MYHKFITIQFLSIFCISIFSLEFAIAEQVKASQDGYSAKLEASLKSGNVRSLGRIGLVMPIFQRPELLTYFTAIAMRDTSKAFEGNFGLGIRKIVGNFIYGAYGFYDVRHTNDNNIIQGATIGTEFLHANYEARVNIYLPNEKNYIHELNSSDNNKKINFINVRQSTEELHETALHGIDFEIGGNLPAHNCLQAFVSYYYFAGKNTSKKVMGFRIRSDYKVNDWLAFDVEYSFDKARGKVFYGGVKINYSFEMRKYQSLNRLQQKMTNVPVRDIDIITDTYQFSGRKLTESVDGDGDDLDVSLGGTSRTSSEFGGDEESSRQVAELIVDIRSNHFREHKGSEVEYWTNTAVKESLDPMFRANALNTLRERAQAEISASENEEGRNRVLSDMKILRVSQPKLIKALNEAKKLLAERDAVMRQSDPANEDFLKVRHSFLDAKNNLSERENSLTVNKETLIRESSSLSELWAQKITLEEDNETLAKIIKMQNLVRKINAHKLAKKTKSAISIQCLYRQSQAKTKLKTLQQNKSVKDMAKAQQAETRRNEERAEMFHQAVIKVEEYVASRGCFSCCKSMPRDVKIAYETYEQLSESEINHYRRNENSRLIIQ